MSLQILSRSAAASGSTAHHDAPGPDQEALQGMLIMLAPRCLASGSLMVLDFGRLGAINRLVTVIDVRLGDTHCQWQRG
jgi:hypothetical protein